MPSIPTPTFIRIGEYLGGVLSMLDRNLAAANLIGSTSYFMFVKRDEFGFFPDPTSAFGKVKNLLRDISYDADDDILRIEMTDGAPTPGVSFSLKIVEAFAGATIATATGNYGVEVPLTSSIDLGPTGNIIVTAPSGPPPGADHPVEIQMVPSGVRLVTDVTGETENEQLVESSALEVSLITAQNLRIPLLEGSRDVVFIERFLQGLLGPFLGSSTLIAFDANLTQDSDGNVLANPLGLLPEFDFLMRTNTPAQTVKESGLTVGSPDFTSLIDPTAFDSIVFANSETPTGQLKAQCIAGFTGGTKDPETFSLQFLATEFDRAIDAPFTLRPFRAFDWVNTGFNITELVRGITTTGTHNTDNRYTDVSAISVPSGRLQVRVQGGQFQINEATTGRFLFRGGDLSAAAKDFRLFDGSRLQFTWDGSVVNETFEIEIKPFHVGDILTIDVTNDGASRVNKSLRRLLDFAFTQTNVSPTIPNSIVAPDLPFVEPVLGA